MCTAISLFCVLFARLQEPAADPIYDMDYGAFLSGTVSAPLPEPNVAIKGVVVRLGADANVLFDTELLRWAAGWTGGFLRLEGTPYDGSHGPHPAVDGRVTIATRTAPGWARAGSFADPRPTPHGPLPRDWAKYRGLYLNGQRVVLKYTVGTTAVLESPSIEDLAGARVLERTLEIERGTAPLVMRVADRDGARAEVAELAALLEREPTKPALVNIARARSGWETLRTGQPSSHDYADQSSGRGVVFRYEPAISKPVRHRAHAKHKDKDKDKDKEEDKEQDARATLEAAPAGSEAAAKAEPEDLTLPALHDGAVPENEDDPAHSVFFDADHARILVDLNASIEIARINTFSWHRGDRSPQTYVLFASNAPTQPSSAGENPAADGWMQVAEVDTSSLGEGGKHGVALVPPTGVLGPFRHLMFDVRRGDHGGTFFSEIDVFGKGENGGGDPREETVPMVTAAVLIDAPKGVRWRAGGDHLDLELPARTETTRMKIAFWDGPASDLAHFLASVGKASKPDDLLALTRGGPSHWPAIETKGELGEGDDAYLVDTITVPEDNPFHSRMRIAGLDFFSDGRAAVSTWNGDVWIVSGIDAKLDKIQWQRFATGLFDPLGLRIVNDVVHTLGRDQITRLHDLNGDGEADYYECFNNDVIASASFHEFAFDLQTDAQGNFYFAKAGPVRSGGRGFEEVLPHHGTVLKVASDGSQLEVYATGFRAPNGIGVGPHGEVTTGDNEGTWCPRCRVNLVKPGGFYGCVPLAHRAETPTSFDQPICFLPMHVDNSGGGQVWVTSDRFGPFQGDLLHLSYGQCELYLVMKEEVDGQMQGGVVRFPLSFASSLMRARFHPGDGALYVAGFKGWQTRAARDTAFQRVRYTGKPAYMPAALHATKTGVAITFTDALDRDSAQDVQNYSIEQWNYMWTERYGSPEVSPSKPIPEAAVSGDNYLDFKEHDTVAIKSATLLGDQKTVVLEIPGLQPVMQMKISINVDAANGALVKHEIYSTIHKLGAMPE